MILPLEATDKETDVTRKFILDPPFDVVVANDGDTEISVLEPPATGETETSVVDLLATTTEKKKRKSQESLPDPANKKQAVPKLRQKTAKVTLGQGGDGSDNSDSDLSLPT
jgi:hypothetical protein